MISTRDRRQAIELIEEAVTAGVSVITVIEGAFFKEFEGPRSRSMFFVPASLPAGGG
jgi:hypothetical protein